MYGKLLVTQDGGKTFTISQVNYENNVLKLKCSVYESILEGGYVDKELLFISKDKGLTWNLEK